MADVTLIVPTGEATAVGTAPALDRGYAVPSGAATGTGTAPLVFETTPDAVGYVYENVGVDLVATREGYGYVYENVGVDLVATREGYGYVYLNGGVLAVNSAEGYQYVFEGDVDNSVPIPHIWFVRPVSGREGDGFSIYGHGFGLTNAQYNGHAYLGAQAGWVAPTVIDAQYQLSETAWQRIAAGADAYSAARSIDPLVGEPTMEHGRIDIVVPVAAVSGSVRVQTNV